MAELGSETKLLLAAFPVLEEILQNREFQTASKKRATQQQQRPEETKFRLNFAVCRFLRVLGEYFAIVMVLDDLQWADVPSLDLLQDILGERDTNKVMIVGIYRSNEVDENHLFSSVMRAIRRKAETGDCFQSQEMEVGNLVFDAILSFLQDLLGTTDNSVMWLANACQKKTYGNVFFTIHFLQYIYSKNWLSYNFGTMQWQWSENEIEHDTMASDNVVDFVLQKMKNLTQEQHDLLRMAACLGASFQESHMTILWRRLHSRQEAAEEENLLDEMIGALDLCILDGYLYESSTSDDTTEFVFVHDKVQEAAHLLTRHDDMVNFQNWIGDSLLETLTAEELAPILFIVVNLLNAGIAPTDPSKVVELAELNSRACAAAMNASAFQAASRHAVVGIQLLAADALELQVVDLGVL